MRPIVNIREEDPATDIGNMDKNLVKIERVVPEISCRTDRQTDTDTQTDALFTILRNRSRRRSNNIVNFLHFTNLHSNLALLFSCISLGYMKLKHNRQSPNRLSVLFKGKTTADLELH